MNDKILKENYVSEEIAIKLKELGFPQVNIYALFEETSECIIPTLALAQKWLREEKDMHVNPYYDEGEYLVYISWYDPEEDSYNDVGGDETFDTYEEALESGIEEAISEILL